MTNNQCSPTEQDYLKNIYALQQETGQASVQVLADRMGVKAPSVTAMIKRLAEAEGGPYVRHAPYRGVELTDRGQAVALEVVRHHRLIELYLATHLDVPWDQVHAEAERLEHAISEDLEDRIAAKLGQPTHDPHGDPIPTREGTIEAGEAVPLSTLEAGARATVTRVPDGEPDLLQYLGELGLVPGTAIEVETVTPVGDVVTVQVAGRPRMVGGTVARRVLVRPEGGS